MSESIKAILHSIQSDMKQVDVISQNIANAQTPGFKSIKTSAVSFETVLNQNSKDVIRQAINTNPGALKVTGSSTDVTLQGDGYFVLERSGSKLKIAKNINLTISENMELSNKLGQGLGIYVNENDLSLLKISPTGELTMGTEVIGNLEVIEVNDVGQLEIGENSQFIVNEKFTAPSEGRVIQGAYEQSNVDSSQEIIRLMMLSKHVESSQRSLLTIDQMLDSGINEIGK